MMREFPAKEQCFFNFNQEYYKVGNRNNPGWGAVLSKKSDAQRLRPNGLALELANRAIFDGGNCLEVTHKGEEPTFDIEGYHFGSIYQKKGKTAKMAKVPMLWAHAFGAENKKSIVLINYDLEKERTVEVKFNGNAKNTKSWILTGDSSTANNEWETGEPQVITKEIKLDGFKSGSKITLPKCSMQVITWDK